MTHTFVHQDSEVLPLYGTGVLKLVNHNIVELGTNLLKDKRSVTFLDERMQQVLGVSQQEDIGLVIDVFHFLFNTAQQSQIIQMRQCQLG